MIFMNFLTRFSLIPLVMATYLGCSEKSSDPDDPSDSFASAREYYDDGNYEFAIQKLGAFKSRFPYSKFAVLAELFIANSHFELGNYEEAAIEYKHFVKLHPKHEKAPFAMYRVGESYWIDAPEDVDRDQELTLKAIEEWQFLTEEFPDSQYSKRAVEKVTLGKRRIADSHQFVADFYCKMELYHACAYRFIKLLEEYPQYKDLRRHALVEAGEALILIASQKKEKPDLDTNIFFKTMSWEQIRDKGQEFKSLAAKIKLQE